MPPAASKSIVLVDDEKSYTELMTGLLAEHLDCTVHAYSRPLDALAALPRLAPAVVVTDYFMPEMNGIEFIRRAAPLAPGVPFIMISGHNLMPVQDQLDRLSALKGFLAKPFSWRVLMNEIRRVWPASTADSPPRADATSV